MKLLLLLIFMILCFAFVLVLSWIDPVLVPQFRALPKWIQSMVYMALGLAFSVASIKAINHILRPIPPPEEEDKLVSISKLNLSIRDGENKLHERD